MVSKIEKFFWRETEAGKVVTALPIEEGEKYYPLIRKHNEDGFKQVILTSEVMVSIVEYFVLKENLNIHKITLIGISETLDNEVDLIIRKMNEERAYFSELIKFLQSLLKNTSINISRVDLKGIDKYGKDMVFNIRSNGVIEISNGTESSMFTKLSDVIKNEIF